VTRFIAFVFLAVSCLAGVKPAASQPDKLVVVTTMSTLGSLIKSVAGDRAEVVNLVPVGASPEDYQPTPRDIERLRNARVLVENGAGLEAWLQHTIDAAKNPSLTTVVCVDGLPVINGNPHLWMNPVYARRYVNKIARALGSADPAGSALYQRNAARFTSELASLDRWIQKQIATIPAAHRRMIVFHNAWQYYDDRYGLTTVGAIELSPGQEPNPYDISRLVTLAKANHVRAVFAEPEYSPKLAQMLARAAGIKTVTNLYDDSLSSGAEARDYISMLQFDTRIIVESLK
jgi:manganese/iron transport system substrate-binding protein